MMPPENDSLRETLESAYEASEQAGRPAADPAQSVRPAAEAAPAAPDQSAAKPGEARDDGRDTHGRFARKEPAAGDAQPVVPDQAKPDAAAAAKPVEGQPGDPAQQVDNFAKAPASWKPGAREKWSTLPPDVREEVYRREHETARTMQQTSQARQVAGAMQQLQQEFAPALAAEGVDVLTATRNLMQMSTRMRYGSPQEKAGLVAQIMQNYGVDIPTLDAILSNQPMPTQQQAQQQFLDPRVDGLLSQIAQARQASVQRVRDEAAREVEAFGAKNDFFNDVRETMADLMEVAAKRGIDLSFQQAYERACQMDPEISRVLAQRAAAGAAQNQQRSTVRNKAAASSVRSTPAVGAPAPAGENLRGAIEAAWDAAASG